MTQVEAHTLSLDRPLKFDFTGAEGKRDPFPQFAAMRADGRWS